MMFINFIQLQAAMGLGLLLATVITFLVLGLLPALTIGLSIKEVKRCKKNGHKLISKKEYAIIILKQLLLSILIILAIIVALFLLIYFFADLSIS